VPTFAIFDLTKSFVNTRAVDALSFSVEGGEVVGPLAPRAEAA